MNLSGQQDGGPNSMFRVSEDKVVDNIISKLTEPTAPHGDSNAEPGAPSNADNPADVNPANSESKDATPAASAPPVIQAEGADDKIKNVTPVELSAEQQQHIKYLNGDDSPAADPKSEVLIGDTSVPAKKSTPVDVELQSKLAEYEATLSDPLIKALAEFRKKTGSNNINEFAETVGLVDPKKLTMEQLYVQDAKDLGFEGAELEDAIEEKMASFQSLPKLDQKRIEKEMRDKAFAKQDERLKSFTITSNVDHSEYEAINTNAAKQIAEKVNKLANTNWRGFLITDELSKTIHELAHEHAIQIFDDKGKLIGYETDDAIEFAIWKAADNGRKILKANFDMGKTSGFEEAMKDRTRISENRSTPTIMPSAHLANEIDSVMKEVATEQNGKVSLSGGAKRN